LQYEEISRQDWEGATKEAERACELRPEIVWPYAVMGWAAEREGRLDAAAQHYGAGLTKLQTSADFTESWRMSDSGPTSNKFVVERFKVLARSRGENYEENPYCAAALALWNPEDRFGGIRRYWLEQGEMAEAALKYDLAYSCYYNAGWDAFSTDEMPEILSRLVRIARAAGWVALTQLAELHLQSAAAM
jgi:hypothetical protein